MSESRDLEAQERAALSIGDRQAAAKARARIEEIAEQRRDYGECQRRHPREPVT